MSQLYLYYLLTDAISCCLSVRMDKNLNRIQSTVKNIFNRLQNKTTDRTHSLSKVHYCRMIQYSVPDKHSATKEPYQRVQNK